MWEFGYDWEQVQDMTPARLQFLQAGLSRFYREEAGRQRRMFKVRR